MTRLLAPLSTSLLLTVAASAQCFETDFGTQIITFADDILSTTQTMNISFPMGGTFATYDQIAVNSNGAAFLWNSTGGAIVGATATGYAGAAATMVTTLRGTAGGSPRIAPYWRDLDTVDVFINTSFPGKTVITWANCIDWSFGGTPFTMQAQLDASGNVTFFYDTAITQLSNAAITGVAAGGGIADPGVTDLSAGAVGVSTTKIVYETFATLNFDLANNMVMFLANGGGGFDVVPVVGYSNCVHASNDVMGVGCHGRGESFYQLFDDAVLAKAALEGNSLQLVPTLNGYVGTWLPGTAGALYAAPTIAATSLATNDDGVTGVTLPSALPIPGGSSTNLTVSHNGIVQVGTTIADWDGLFDPDGADVAAAVDLAFLSWTDFRDNNATPVASGVIKTELVGNSFNVTWENVDHWATPQVTAPSTVQFQLDLTTGVVTMVWLLVDNNTTSTFGSEWMVGWTNAGAGTDPGSALVSAPATTGTPEIFPMTLTASPIPVINPSTTVTYTVSNLPEFIPTSGVYISTTFLSVAPFPGGFPLTGILANVAGCNAYIFSLDLDLGAQVTFAPTASWNFTYDNVNFLAGQSFGVQTVSLFDPSFPLFNGENGGFQFSNGILSTVQLQ